MKKLGVRTLATMLVGGAAIVTLPSPASAAIPAARTTIEISLSMSSNPTFPNLGYGQVAVEGVAPPRSAIKAGVIYTDVSDPTSGAFDRIISGTYSNFEGADYSAQPPSSSFNGASFWLPTTGPASVCGHTLKARAWFVHAKTGAIVRSSERSIVARCGPKLGTDTSGKIRGRYFTNGKPVELTFRRSDTGQTVQKKFSVSVNSWGSGFAFTPAPANQTSGFLVEHPFGKGCFGYTVVGKDVTTGQSTRTLTTVEGRLCPVL